MAHQRLNTKHERLTLNMKQHVRNTNRDPKTNRFVKINITPDQDSIIRSCWASEKWNLTAAKKAAKLTGLTYTCCARRAMELGIYSAAHILNRSSWTDEEIDILEAGINKLHTILTIQKTLAGSGSKRTLTAIRDQISVNKMRSGRTGMTQKDLAAALGVGPMTIEKWRAEGKIHGKRLPDIYPGGRVYDLNVPWNYSRAAIRVFIYSYPHLIDLRRVDQVWFLDLMNTTDFNRPKRADEVAKRLRRPATDIQIYAQMK